MDKGDIIYIQGAYKGIVEKDLGLSVRVEPLEGIAKRCKGKVFNIAKSLIKKRRG